MRVRLPRLAVDHSGLWVLVWRREEAVLMYDVVLLVEEELSVPDAERVAELYASVPDQVKFHVIIPCDDAKASVEASLSGLAGTELYGIAAEQYSIESDEEVLKAQRAAQRAVDAH